MSVFASAYLLYGLPIKNYCLDQIMNDSDHEFFDQLQLKYLRPSEYVCKQYIPLFGLKIAEHEECDHPLVIKIPTDLPRHFQEALIEALGKLEQIYLAYETREDDFEKRDLEDLITSIREIRNTGKPALILAINKL